MIFSYNWLQKYFAEPLPKAEDLAEKITFHSSEIEEIVTTNKGVVFDIKVLPDKSAWLMSHRGMAKELSVILDIPLSDDPFSALAKLESSDKITISREGDTCDFYSAALIEGVEVGPSPDWLKEELELIGQRSINNIVDATNFVMFALGQPLHAFSANKLSENDGVYSVGVRPAKDGEEIIALTGETYQLSSTDAVIVDGQTDVPIGIAGVKGGMVAGVDKDTTTVLLESAHFERKAVRNTAKRLKLPTDASKRYENGISVAVAPIALHQTINLILAVAGGKLVGQNSSGQARVEREPVSCSLKKLNSVLGLSLKMDEVTDIIKRFGYRYEEEGSQITVYPPFERDDLVIEEDLIEEVGRIYGLHHVASIVPDKSSVSEYNPRHYYAERIRDILVSLGFSEVYTSSFRSTDEVKLENALASDKGCLRSSLVKNLEEARTLNVFNKDVLGILAVKIFEIGTVFNNETEEFRVALAVQSGVNYKDKVDVPLLEEAQVALVNEFGELPEFIYNENGVIEFSLEKLLAVLPPVEKYSSVDSVQKINYKSFSNYPAISRDIAMWVNEGVDARQVMSVLEESAGPLCVLITHVDTFSKEGRTSLAFRLVFQSFERTLTDGEVQGFMDDVYKNVEKQGWETR